MSDTGLKAPPRAWAGRKTVLGRYFSYTCSRIRLQVHCHPLVFRHRSGKANHDAGLDAVSHVKLPSVMGAPDLAAPPPLCPLAIASN